MATITGLEVVDIRFPTSRSLDGSDAMNPDPDYSAAYVVLRTDARRRPRGPRPDVHDRARDGGRRRGGPRRSSRSSSGAPSKSSRRTWAASGASIVGDSQLRWIGPEKGAIHLATAAVVNAVWDLLAKRAGKPLWKLLVDMTPEQLVDARRLPLPDRCPDPRRGAGDLIAPLAAWKAERAESCCATATRPTRPPSAGSATPTTRSGACAAKRWPTAGRGSR